ncbi:uncharacterized protein [Procambarus clarkii]|uniref:uncharacterized protein n=1 Tax=Procambarus clarkii TaxID=6728 RepID=UPI0037437F06
MATPEQLRRTYIGLKDHLTRLINKSETLSKATPIDYHQLEISLRVADLKFDQVRCTIRSYLDILNATETDPDEIDQTLAETSQYEDDTQDKLNVLYNLVSQHEFNANNTVSQSSVQLLEVRLPTLDLPTFAGLDEENWDTFWTSYEVHIHKKPSLDKVSKFSYLNSLLKGEAKKVINNLALTENIYEEAIKLLKLNYCNKELSIANLYYQLLDLNAPSNRPDSLQSFRLEVESLVKVLELHRCTKCMGSHDPSKCVVHLRLCSRCNKGMHHYALCRKTSSQSITPREDSMNCTTVQYCKVYQEINVPATDSGNNTTLPTAQLKLINRKSRVNTRGLFDQGSQKTLITQQLVEQLKLKPAKRVRLNISGFLTNCEPREYQVARVLVRLGSSTNSVQAVVVDKLPSDLQVTGLARTAKYLRRNRMRVDLQEEDHDYTKFLLIKDPLDPDSDVVTYRFASVLFGATSSPFLLQATLDTHLKKSNSSYKAEISNNLYVDNFQGTTNDKFKLLEIYHEANPRVAPIKKRSLPQIELTGLLVGVRLAHCLTKTLNNIHLGEIVVWSDNEAVLQWVRNNNNNKTPYVSNRVKEIHELSAGYKFRHVPANDNPADYLSKGLSLKQIIKSPMWFNGPSWLVNDQWPKQKPQVIVTNITTPMTDPEPHRILAINPHNYSNLTCVGAAMIATISHATLVDHVFQQVPDDAISTPHLRLLLQEVKYNLMAS